MGIANYITLFRLFSIPAIAYYYLLGRFDIALWLLLFAGFSDLLDGYLARRLGQRTKLGAILDPLADKSLMLVCFVTLAYKQQVPYWLVALVVGRDLYIVLGVWLLKIYSKKLYIKPTYLSKLTTFFQLGFLFFTFLKVALEVSSLSILLPWKELIYYSQNIMIGLVVIMTFASAIHYTLVAWAIFREELKQRRGLREQS